MAKTGLTNSEFEKRKKELLSQMKRAALPFPQDAEAQRARIERAKNDKMFFKETYFPHYCKNPSPEFHRDLFAITDIVNEPVAATATRGGAKSVTVSLVDVAHKVAYETRWFIIFISDTSGLAEDFVRYVRLEFEENDRLRQDFGDLTGKRTWGDGELITANNRRILARGSGQRVRGLRHGPHRPDHVILDDFENDEEQHNPKRLEKKEQWIKEVVLPALEPDGWSLIYVGTLLSSISVLARFMDRDQSPEWRQFNFPAIVKDEKTGGEKSFWPERFPISHLHARRRQMGDRSFNQEYMGIALDEETQAFRAHWFRREPLGAALLREAEFSWLYADASAKSGETNDYKALVTMAWARGKYYVLHCYIRHQTTNWMMDAMYDLCDRFGAVCNGMEEVAFQSLFRDLFRMYGEKRKRHLPVKYRGGLAPKETRILSLQSLVENGLIVFCENGDGDAGDMDLLLDQLKYFPNPSVNDDGPDALEGAVWLGQQLGAGEERGVFQEIGERRTGLKMFFDERDRFDGGSRDETAGLFFRGGGE